MAPKHKSRDAGNSEITETCCEYHRIWIVLVLLNTSPNTVSPESSLETSIFTSTTIGFWNHIIQEVYISRNRYFEIL